MTSIKNPQHTQLRYLALGDSYTIGEGVVLSECWPMQLAQRLRANGLDIAEPKIIARTGWTTDELASALGQADLNPPYTLVTLLIGVNNQYRGRTADQYRDEFCNLLQYAIMLGNEQPHRVLVLSIPDWGCTPFGKRSGRDLAQVTREIDAFNAINREESIRHQVNYLDVTNITRMADAHSLTVEDGLHPSAAMYYRWTEKVLPVATMILANQSHQL